MPGLRPARCWSSTSTAPPSITASSSIRAPRCGREPRRRRIPVIVATGACTARPCRGRTELGRRQPLVCYQGALVREMPGRTARPVRRSSSSRSARRRRVGARTSPASRTGTSRRTRTTSCSASRTVLRRGCTRGSAGCHSAWSPDLEPLLAHRDTKAAVRHRGPRRGGSRHRVDDAGSSAASARVTRSNPEFVEILDPDVSKAAGCEIVWPELGSTLADAVAVGDAPNYVEPPEPAGFPWPSPPRDPVLAAADATCAPPEDGRRRRRPPSAGDRLSRGTAGPRSL